MSRRAPLLALLLFASAFVLPAGAAQQPQLSDAEGDVEAVVQAGVTTPGAPAAGEGVDAVDLVSLAIAETEDAFRATVGVKSLKGTFTGARYDVDFTWNGREYRVRMGYFVFDSPVGGEFRFANLLVRNADRYELAAELEAIVDREAGTVSASVPKVYVLDGSFRIPGRGDRLTDIVVTSDRSIDPTFFLGTSLTMRDRMPDEGGAEHAFQMGDFSQGSLLLSSPQRIRVSNGGATTFVFEAHLRNLGDAQDEYRLSAADAPGDWKVTFETPVRVPPKETRVVPVLVSVPFGHEHGGFDSFNLSAKGAAGEGRMRLGVLHTPVPQPTGHHSELWLHADDPRSGALGEVFSQAFPFATGWMNTVSDHEGDAEGMFPNSFPGGGAVEWRIPLNPGLQIGMDFDIERDGHLMGAVVAGSGEATITANLYHVRQAGGSSSQTLLARGTSADLMLDPQGHTPFELVLTPTPESDYIAYEGPADLVLVVTMKGGLLVGFNNPTFPRLGTEAFHLELPLEEYHDRLTGLAEAQSAITITAEGPVEKLGRPGSIQTYVFDVANTGGSGDVFVLDLAGNHAYRGRVIPSGAIPLGPGESRKVTLAVEIPVDANEGQPFEVLLFVHARDDPSKMAIARTKTTATLKSEANPDETDVMLKAQAENDNVPAPGAALVAVGAALAAASWRRRAGLR